MSDLNTNGKWVYFANTTDLKAYYKANREFHDSFCDEYAQLPGWHYVYVEDGEYDTWLTFACVRERVNQISDAVRELSNELKEALDKLSEPPPEQEKT